jgi:hypothetical protein
MRTRRKREAMAFKTSINVKFDLGNDEFVTRYLPTPSHAEVLKGLLEGLSGKGDHSHIIIGPYGTGKSLIATVVSNIASKLVSQGTINELIKKFEKVDDYISEKIREVSQIKRKYIPVVLNGNEGRFRKVIVLNILKKLHEHKIHVRLPGVSEKIIQTIELWKEQYPATYEQFRFKLKNDKKDFRKWINSIRNQDEKEFEYFAHIFPDLTSGASFDIDYEQNFILQVEYITEVLNKHNLGILIVYDEFGRFLQSLDSSKIHETMQDLQDLSELANRVGCLQLLLITHKSLRQYFESFNREFEKEFRRIEKRFRQYFIQSDQATFLRIAESIVSTNLKQKPKIGSELLENMKRQLRKYPLFPSLNQTEREKIVIESMYPLHPVALFMLPYLSRIFGQNERTLFTFLESNETGGFSNYIKKAREYYKPYQLFDYFFHNTADISIDEEFADYFKLYRKSLAKIPDKIDGNHKQLSINIIKFITLWNICGLQREQKLSTDFIAFAMQIGSEELESLLSLLSAYKLVRFNRINGYWELYSGSSVNIEEKIEDRKKAISMSKDKILKILQQNLDKRYYLAEYYNDQKGMTRFAKIKFILGNDLFQKNNSIKQDNEADLTIYYVIPDEEGQQEKIKKVLLNIYDEKLIFVVHPQTIKVIQEEIIKTFILEELKNDKNFLSEDQGILEELEILSKEVNYIISSYLSMFTRFENSLTWISMGQIIAIDNERELIKLLSKRCGQLYDMTPIILNDSFNRRNITTAQKKAAIHVIDCIIDNPFDEQFGIKGMGPDYLIYATIFKNNGHFDKNINAYDFSNISYKPYQELRKKLVRLLRKKPKGSFKEIIDIFVNKPFGIRRPVIPVLLVALLRDVWDDFMLYRNNMFVSGLKGEKIYKILEEEGPENYEYVYERLDEKYLEFFSQLEKYFQPFLEKRLEGQSRLILICGTLIKWLRSQPRFTQISNHVNNEFAWLRDLIRRTEINPQESIANLFDKYSKNMTELLKLKEYAEHYLDNFKENLIQEIYNSFNIKTFEELKDWALNQNEFNKKNNKLVKIIQNLNEDNWLESFVTDYIGVKIDDWSDTTYELFIKQLKYDLKAVSVDAGINKSAITVIVDGTTKVISQVDLSVKAQTIYENLKRIVHNAGRTVPKNEIEYMVYKLLQEFVD